MAKPNKTCQHTFRILSKRIREIEADAKSLAVRTRKEVAEKLAALREAKAMEEKLKAETRAILIGGECKVPVSIQARAITAKTASCKNSLW